MILHFIKCLSIRLSLFSVHFQEYKQEHVQRQKVGNSSHLNQLWDHTVAACRNHLLITHCTLFSTLSFSPVHLNSLLSALLLFDTNKQWKLLGAGVPHSRQSSQIKSYGPGSAILTSHAACQLQTHSHQKMDTEWFWNIRFLMRDETVMLGDQTGSHANEWHLFGSVHL